MDRSKLFKFLIIVVLGAGIVISQGFAEDVIIIEPEPDDDIIIPVEPPVEPPAEPPEEPPTPPEPEIIEAVIDVDPDTINLDSNRKYITVYTELPEAYDVNDVKADSIKIVSVNSESVSPVLCLSSKSEVGDNDADGIADLMVKFDFSTVKPILSNGYLEIGIEGEMSSGKAFAGSNGIKTNTNNGNGNSKSDNKFKFNLKKYISESAEIKQVVLWINLPKGIADAVLPEAWHLKSMKNWEKVQGKRENLNYSNLKKGYGCTFNLTDKVLPDWQNGITDVIVQLDEQIAGKCPVLLIRFEDESGVEIVLSKGARKQNLKSIGQKYIFTKGSVGNSQVTLQYTDSEVSGLDERLLSIYYWESHSETWKEVSSCVLSIGNNSLTCNVSESSFYQILAKKPVFVNTYAEPEETKKSKNALGQNYPNPFNPATTINYGVEKDCHVTIKLYSTAGELVAVIVDGFKQAGPHTVTYDAGESLARGIYFYQLIAGDFVDTKRMAVLK